MGKITPSAFDINVFFFAEMKIELTGPECLRNKNGKQPFCKMAPLQFYINGRNALNYPKRGFNIVVLDSHTGRVERTMTFETGIEIKEGTKLAFQLQNLKQFKIVIGGVLESESKYVIPSAKLVIVSDFEFPS